MPESIKIENVTKTFVTGDRSLDALGPLTLEIAAGEFTCVLGQSGCGKSTLFRLVAGLEEPTSGTVLIGDRPVEGPDPQVGVVFQDPALLPWLSVRRNIELGFRIRGEQLPHDRVSAAIELVGLEGFVATKPGSLSGGMAQRVALARALVNEPQVLLLDEPFAALDALTRVKMQKELLRLWSKNEITTLFITHDVDEALTLATRIVVLTPRPGRVGRIFQVPLSHPRRPTAPEFMRLKGVILEELEDLVEEADGRIG